MTGPLLHIGYHKTGSTWLQRTLFGQADYGFALPYERRVITALIVKPDPFGFSASAVRDALELQLDEARSLDLVPVISHERLSGYPPAGGFDAREIAHRLHAVFPDARILIVIREQKSLIRSMYTQYVRDGGVRRPHDYLQPLQPNLVRTRQFGLEFYEFDQLIRHYQHLFGNRAVLVLPLEMLARSADDFVARIAALVGVSPGPPIAREGANVAIPPGSVPLMRLGNRLFNRNQLGPGALFPWPPAARLAHRLALAAGRTTPRFIQRRLEGRYRNYIGRTVGPYYAASNRRTSELIGIDLSQYGYDCVGQAGEPVA